MQTSENQPSVEPEPLSFGQRLLFVWAWFFRGLFDGRLAARLRGAQLDYDRLEGRALPGAPERPSLPPSAPPPTEPSVDVAASAQAEIRAEARREAVLVLLGILQREGRFVDFVQQDIAAFSDADIGAAARLVHAGCRKALQEHVPVEPVLEQTEGSAVRVEPGYDPAAYKLTGNVAGSAPYTGVLRHKGWRVRSLSLPETVAGAAPDVLMPAEVEVQ
ncbi:MAG: DUF2760 domain-containing protein [Myxococcales bacterium]|jgi:hypothetical protein|nr:DUF2760 domain-containing protein [Myxococcales bacterium]